MVYLNENYWEGGFCQGKGEGHRALLPAAACLGKSVPSGASAFTFVPSSGRPEAGHNL